MDRPGCLVCLAAALGLIQFAPHAAADDFRIETKVFQGSSKSPLSANLTLFRAGVVYDYLAEPHTVAILDRVHDRIVLLDIERTHKTELSASEVESTLRELQSRTRLGSDFLKFTADPQFDVGFDPDTGELILAHKLIKYEVQTDRANSPHAARQLREFYDTFAQLNSVLRPEGLLPFPRMKLNEELARHELVPKEVKLTFGVNSPLQGRELTRRSEHFITWRLLDDDMKRISATERQLATFTSVGLDEYRKSTQAERLVRGPAGK